MTAPRLFQLVAFLGLFLSETITLSSQAEAAKSHVMNASDSGAECNGTNDDTSAIQSAITAASSTPGSSLELPAGVCVITSTLVAVLASDNALNIEGQGRLVTYLEFRLPPNS